MNNDLKLRAMLYCQQGLLIALLSFRFGCLLCDDSKEHLYLINFENSDQGFIWSVYCMVWLYSHLMILWLCNVTLQSLIDLVWLCLHGLHIYYSIWNAWDNVYMWIVLVYEPGTVLNRGYWLKSQGQCWIMMNGYLKP